MLAPLTADPAAQAPEPAPAAPAPDPAAQFPQLSPILSGAVPGVIANKHDANDPLVKQILADLPAVLDLGLGLYRSKAGTSSVLFNPSKVTEEQLKKADKAGKLEDIFPHFASALRSATGAAPALATAAPAPTPMPMSAPDPLLAVRRAQQALPGSPTSGPAPGRGRILNSLLS